MFHIAVRSQSIDNTWVGRHVYSRCHARLKYGKDKTLQARSSGDQCSNCFTYNNYSHSHYHCEITPSPPLFYRIRLGSASWHSGWSHHLQHWHLIWVLLHVGAASLRIHLTSMSWRNSRKWSKCLIPWIHGRDLDEVPGSWFHPGLTLTVGTNEGVNQWRRTLSHPLSNSSKFKKKKNKTVGDRGTEKLMWQGWHC